MSDDAMTPKGSRAHIKLTLTIAAGVVLALVLWNTPGWYRSYAAQRRAERNHETDERLAAIVGMMPNEVVKRCGKPATGDDGEIDPNSVNGGELDYTYPNDVTVVFWYGNGHGPTLGYVQHWKSFEEGRENLMGGDDEPRQVEMLRKYIPCLLK